MKPGDFFRKTSIVFLFAGLVTAAVGQSSAPSTPALRPVLVELFTSEGCSSCPPADELLKQMDGKRTEEGQVIIGLSEHVTYWNHEGWSDPFSQSVFTDRQNVYGQRFHLDSVYTPQMVVDGVEQVSGGNVNAVLHALHDQDRPEAMVLHIDSVALADKKLGVTFSVTGQTVGKGVDIFAVIAENAATSNVLRGENGGHTLNHVSVARNMVRVARVKASGTVTVSLPDSAQIAAGSGRHLVLFAQENGQGRILAADHKDL